MLKPKHESTKIVELTLKCALICHYGVCDSVTLAVTFQGAVKCLRSVGFVYICLTLRDTCDISCAVEDLGSEWPGRHAGMHTAKCDRM